MERIERGRLYGYPKLAKLLGFFRQTITPEQKEKLSKTKILACQHILEPQMKMFEFLVSLGVKPENIHLLGKIYSTNFEVLESLRNLGLDAKQPPFDFANSFDAQHRAHCAEMVDSFGEDGCVVLDDGAQILELMLGSGFKFKGVEQTSSGFRKLEGKELNSPIINVARSSVKLVEETPFIVKLGIFRLKDQIELWGLKNPKILVVGLGPIGEEMLKQLSLECDVFGVDKKNGDAKIVENIIEKEIDIVVGATGSVILSHEDMLSLGELDRNLYFVSMSSSDREFEIWRMRDVFKIKNVHDEAVYKNLHIANNGFPITFKGNRFESNPEEIEKTIGLLFGSTMHLVLTDVSEKGMIDVPKYIVDLIK